MPKKTKGNRYRRILKDMREDVRERRGQQLGGDEDDPVLLRQKRAELQDRICHGLWGPGGGLGEFERGYF